MGFYGRKLIKRLADEHEIELPDDVKITPCRPGYSNSTKVVVVGTRRIYLMVRDLSIYFAGAVTPFLILTMAVLGIMAYNALRRKPPDG